MTTYIHLTIQERAQIELLSKQGKGPTAISQALSGARTKSTVSRELNRAGARNPLDGCYDATLAHESAAKIAQTPRRASKLTQQRRDEINECLADGWSPQQIAGNWKLEGRAAEERLSHESIYELIGRDRKADGTLWQLLPRGGKPRRLDRCGTRRGHRLKVKPEQEIAARPELINNRERFGDWEVDLVIGAGQQGVLLVAVERQSRLTKMVALPSKEAAVCHAALVLLLASMVVLSLTYDRGLEWMEHEAIAHELGAKSYFCKAYHSWEKGAVENTNGLIRRFLPKKEPFPYEEMDHEWLQEQEDSMNRRPRMVLGYQKPNDIVAAVMGPWKAA